MEQWVRDSGKGGPSVAGPSDSCGVRPDGGSRGGMARPPDRPALAGLKIAITSFFFLIALVLAPPLLMGAAIAAGRTLAHTAKPRRELFCRFSMALLPVGLAMWGA
jgi:hypothetical protein